MKTLCYRSMRKTEAPHRLSSDRKLCEAVQRGSVCFSSFLKTHQLECFVSLFYHALLGWLDNLINVCLGDKKHIYVITANIHQSYYRYHGWLIKFVSVGREAIH